MNAETRKYAKMAAAYKLFASGFPRLSTHLPRPPFFHFLSLLSCRLCDLSMRRCVGTNCRSYDLGYPTLAMPEDAIGWHSMLRTLPNCCERLEDGE